MSLRRGWRDKPQTERKLCKPPVWWRTTGGIQKDSENSMLQTLQSDNGWKRWTDVHWNGCTEGKAQAKTLSLLSRLENANEATVRYQYTPIRMAKMNESSGNAKYAERTQREQIVHTWLAEAWNGTATLDKTVEASLRSHVAGKWRQRKCPSVGKWSDCGYRGIG